MALDTAPIRKEERFDEGGVTAYLREHLRSLVGDETILYDQFPGGAANLTYRAVAGQTELVLRRAPLGAVAVGGHDMAREYRVLSRLWRAFPAAPRALHYCEDPAVMGKPFLVMERRTGHVVRASWPAGLDESRRRTVAEGLVDTLGALHSVDPVAVELQELGRPAGFVARQVDGWAKRWVAAATRDLPDMAASHDLLRERMPEPQAVAILHNDYKLDNTMISETGAVVAVLDWDMATLGDPLVDLGTTLAYWVDVEGPTQAVFGERVRPLTPYMAPTEVVERYGAATSFDVSLIDYYVGLAYYRIAVILEQIYARYKRGQTTDRRFEGFEAAAPLLAAAAREALEGDAPVLKRREGAR